MSTDRLRLQSLLAFDAATCTAMGLLLLTAADMIAALTRLPAPLLFWAGAVLLPIAAFMAVFSRAKPVPRWAARLVIAGNAAWVLASVALPAIGLARPTRSAGPGRSISPAWPRPPGSACRSSTRRCSTPRRWR